MAISSKDVTITINSTDFSNEINQYDESGGERTYIIVHTKGSGTKRIETGRTDIEVKFNFRMIDIDLNTLFEVTTPFTIVVDDATNSLVTITYSNMLPTGLKISQQAGDILIGEMTFTAPAYTGGTYNRAIA